MDWASCFPAGTRVLAMPDWTRPRLYLSGRTPAGRWSDSQLFPAFRLVARGYRLLARTKALAGFGEMRVAGQDRWEVGRFVGDALPQIKSVTVMVGSKGVQHRWTAQLRDGRSRVVGYLKWAGDETARARLRHEHDVLNRLPEDVGPVPLKHGPLGDGEGLLMSPVPGRRVAASLPPPDAISGFLRSLQLSVPMPLDEHPWARRIREKSDRAASWLDQLSGRWWPMVVQHGDLAPWNLIAEHPTHRLHAVDWEQATLDGFPMLDLCHYLLQVGSLVYRWSPRKTFRYALRYLTHVSWPGLDGSEAGCLVKLQTMVAYEDAIRLGFPPEERFQSWRRALMEERA